MKAETIISWWANMVVLENMNAHFILLETEAIVCVGLLLLKQLDQLP